MNVMDISKMLKAYSGVTFIPSTSFSRDKYKGTLDGDTNKVHMLDRDEVEEYIKSGRLNKHQPKN